MNMRQFLSHKVSRRMIEILLSAALGINMSVIGHAAELKVGIILSETGAAANFTKSIRNVIDIWPKEINGQTLKLIIQDDRSDVTTATTIARRLMTDEKVDVLLGPVLTPNAVAAAPLADEGQTTVLPLAPVPMKEGKPYKWAFNVTPPISLMGAAVVDDMIARGVKTVGLIGYSDTWGDQWVAQLRTGESKGLKVVADERYGRTDTSVTGQVLKLISLNPDAILVAASYAGAGLPQVELVGRGYKGKIYHTQGIDRLSFMKAAGKSAEGILFPIGPSGLARELPDTVPTKALSVKFVQDYEAANGPDTYSSSGAHTWDVIEILRAALPTAMKAGQPGTPEFRAGLRAGIESAVDIVGSNGVYSFSPEQHVGLIDSRSVYMASVKNGKWVVAPKP